MCIANMVYHPTMLIPPSLTIPTSMPVCCNQYTQSLIERGVANTHTSKMKIQDIKTTNIVRDRKERSGSMIDSGMVVIISIILAMIFMVFLVLFTVKHEWCPVLFKNNTVSKNYIN
jgi:hypothetical protein